MSVAELLIWLRHKQDKVGTADWLETTYARLGKEHANAEAEMRRFIEAVRAAAEHDHTEDWDAIKDDIMREALCLKFTTHVDLKEKLLKTNDSLLIEATKGDYYWGVGSKGSGNWYLVGRAFVVSHWD